MLSDCHSAALVSRAGSIDWLCFPRFDAASIFGRILDEDGGYWSIGAAGPHEASRRYVPETLVLETELRTPTGTAVVTEALVFADDERGHGIGLAAPHVLVRTVEAVEGEVPIDVEFAPRPEYGLIVPRLVPIKGGLIAQGGATQVLLAGPQPHSMSDGIARWQLALKKGERCTFTLQHHMAWDAPTMPWPAKQARKRLADTVKGWTSWSRLHQRYEGPWKDEVHNSGRVLHALTFRPTGAIVAAPTTSLPEEEGGSRNWDYRYCWLRDASMTLQALWVAACPDEVGRFLGFVARAAGPGGQGLQIMFGIGGEHDLAERELDHLRGWRDSRPVRVGNGAWNQQQHDVYGAVLDAVYRFRGEITEFDPHTVELLVALADGAARVWSEPDQGIWEIRGEPRHFLHSKLMCWVALDRAARLAHQLGVGHRTADWSSTAATIRQGILDNGWNEEVGAYTQSFGSDELDASVLLLALSGFLPPSDARLRSTIDAIARDLSAPSGLLYRYRQADGLDGDESTFLLCSYWLVEAWAMTGQLDLARQLFDRTTSNANDLGLLGEEAHAETGELLGNFPQAFSHIGLVNAASAISVAERADRTSTD